MQSFDCIHCLAIPLALAALSVRSAGLRVMRGMADDTALEGYRTAGTLVALMGVVLQLASIIIGMAATAFDCRRGFDRSG